MTFKIFFFFFIKGAITCSKTSPSNYTLWILNSLTGTTFTFYELALLALKSFALNLLFYEMLSVNGGMSVENKSAFVLLLFCLTLKFSSFDE